MRMDKERLQLAEVVSEEENGMVFEFSTEEDYYFKQLKQRRKSVSFKITDQIFELMYETCINIKINNDYLTAYNDVKKILTIQNKTSYFKFLLDIQVILFIEIALKCGKYKDCLKMVNLILKEKSIFSHFF